MNLILNKKWDANHPETRILKIHTQNKANGIFDIFFLIFTLKNYYILFIILHFH